MPTKTPIFLLVKSPADFQLLLAKLIAGGEDKEQATAQIAKALDEFVVEGIKTTIPFHQRVIGSELFAKGDLSTSFIDRLMEEEPG